MMKCITLKEYRHSRTATKVSISYSSIYLNKQDCSPEWTSKGGRWFSSDKGVFRSSWWSGLLNKGHKKKTKSLICQLTILAVDCVIYLIAGSVDFRDLDTQIKHRTCCLIPSLRLWPFYLLLHVPLPPAMSGRQRRRLPRVLWEREEDTR